jgi:hypothetical protein
VNGQMVLTDKPRQCVPAALVFESRTRRADRSAIKCLWGHRWQLGEVGCPFDEIQNLVEPTLAGLGRTRAWMTRMGRCEAGVEA